MIGMEDYRTRPLYALSGGQKQLIAIASILVMQPKILLLDEPTANLDPAGSEKVYTVMDSIRKKMGVTIILIDHKLDMILSAAGTDFRIIGLKEGQIIADGPARDILCDVDLVNHIGLKPLDSVLLCAALRDKGIDAASFLTVDEAVSQIAAYLEGGEKK